MYDLGVYKSVYNTYRRVNSISIINMYILQLALKRGINTDHPIDTHSRGGWGQRVGNVCCSPPCLLREWQIATFVSSEKGAAHASALRGCNGGVCSSRSERMDKNRANFPLSMNTVLTKEAENEKNLCYTQICKM